MGWGLAFVLVGLLLTTRAHMRFHRRNPPGSVYWETHTPGSRASVEPFIQEEPMFRVGFFCMAILAPIFTVTGLAWLIWVIVT
jgi:uncharacterized iron-regulated membrane protein